MLRGARGGSPSSTKRCAPSACAACSVRARSASRACCCARRVRCELRARSSRRSICAASPSKRRNDGDERGCAASPSASPPSSSSASTSARGGAPRCRRREPARRVFLGDRPDEYDGADRRARGRASTPRSSCRSRRSFSTPSAAATSAAAREPDFARLGFALAGCTSQRALAAESAASVFADAELIEPEDFSAEQAYRLAVAFGGEQELAQALMDRICAWTGGHPYLTQRVARGVARKGGRLEDVERVVREQLLAPGAADKDPLLGSRARLARRAVARVAPRATKLLQKLAAGGKVARACGCGGVGAACGSREPFASTASAGSACATASSRSSSPRGWLKAKAQRRALARGGRGRLLAGARGRRLLVHAALARRRHRDA